MHNYFVNVSIRKLIPVKKNVVSRKCSKWYRAVNVNEEKPISSQPLNAPNISDCGISFSLELHNNNNLSQRYIVNTKKCNWQYCYANLSNIQIVLKKNLSLNFDEELILNSLFKNIENPFCASAIPNINCMNGSNQKNIWAIWKFLQYNTEIWPVYQRGEINYDEVESILVFSFQLNFNFNRYFKEMTTF